MSVSPETNRGDGDPRESGPLSAGADAVGACHCPPGGEGVDWGERVVTGAKIGLRANGGKEIANRNLRAALVTGWYGAAIHRAATGSVVG